MAPENRNGVIIMARTSTPAPAPYVARSAPDAATTPEPAPVALAAGDSPEAAVLAALSADPAGATVAVIAARAGISTAAARQALIAHEKEGTATRVKGSRPGIADAWKPDAPAAPPAEAPGSDSTPGDEQPAAEPAGSTADASQPAPAPADDTTEGQQADAGAEPGPDPAVTAEAAGTVAAIAQAAAEAGKALAAGDLDAAMTALETARDLAAQGRRAVKAAASGRRAPRDPARRAARPGGGPPAQVPRRGLHPAPGRQGAHPVGRRGRQRPRQAGQPRCGADGHRQAPHLPARPRRLHVYLPCPKPGRPALPPGVTPSRRAGRRPLPARYIRALTGVVSRQVHGRDTRGTRRATGRERGFPQ